MNTFQKIYKLLLKEYHPQGWWPIINEHTLMCEYHNNAPRNESEMFEICVGALLTQGTQWYPNVVRALINLKRIDVTSPKSVLNVSDDKLKTAIKPAGYFNQKARKLREFTTFFYLLAGKIPTREQLLSVWGVGNETADSILLYAFKIPVFVVDAYTRRIFSRIGLCSANATYEEIQALFHKSLPKKYELFNEYHALIVKLAKRNCAKNLPKCSLCSINKMCRKLV